MRSKRKNAMFQGSGNKRQLWQKSERKVFSRTDCIGVEQLVWAAISCIDFSLLDKISHCSSIWIILSRVSASSIMSFRRMICAMLDREVKGDFISCPSSEINSPLSSRSFCNVAFFHVLLPADAYSEYCFLRV